MRFRLLGLVIMGLLLWGGTNGVQAKGAPSFMPSGEEKAKFAPEEVLVKFKGVRSEGKFGPAAEREFLADLPPAAHAALKTVQGKVKKVFPVVGVVQVRTSAKLTVGQAIEALYRSGAVEYAEPNFWVQAYIIPNDDRFSEQWGLHNTGGGGTVDADIDAPAGWDIIRSGVKTVVAVIDTGVDYTHEDLTGSTWTNMWKNPKEIPANGIDDDNNGFVDDVYGIDAYNGDADPMDDHGHGTHCAGIIGARGNNAIGVCGVNWAAKIMALKFLNHEGGGYVDGALACMEYALAIKQKNNYPRMVWSNSWGGPEFSQALYDMFAAAGNAGVLAVCAAGNAAQDIDIGPCYPAAFDLPNIITVGASNAYDSPASFSNFGARAVDLFAPGESILSSLPGNSYAAWSGTSMACPHVAGAAGLVWSKNYTLNWKQIKGLILNGAEDGTAMDFAGRCLTEGRLNLANSLNSGLLGVPAIFQVTPNLADTGETITVTGVNFGASPGTLAFQGVNLTISSWSDETIVAKIGATIPWGPGRLRVTTASGTSRGAYFTHDAKEALVGQTIIPHGWGARAQVGTNIWLIGGATYWGQTGLTEKYPLKTGRAVIDAGWMMPVALTNTAAGVLNGKIYVAGGMSWETWQVSDALQVFDTVTGTWSAGAPMPVKRLQAAAVGCPGNQKVYVFGGMDENFAVMNTTYEYDPASDTWTAKAAMPTATTYPAATLTSTGRVWVMGGFSTPNIGTEQKTVQEYNPATDKWYNRPSLKKARTGAGAVTYGTKIFCLHGSGAAPNGNIGWTDGEFYSSGSWKNAVFGFENLYTPAAGRLNNRIFSIGGLVYRDDWGARVYSKNVWRFTSP